MRCARTELDVIVLASVAHPLLVLDCSTAPFYPGAPPDVQHSLTNPTIRICPVFASVNTEIACVRTNPHKFSQSTRRLDAILYQLTDTTSDLESRIGTKSGKIADKSAKTHDALSYNGDWKSESSSVLAPLVDRTPLELLQFRKSVSESYAISYCRGFARNFVLGPASAGGRRRAAAT